MNTFIIEIDSELPEEVFRANMANSLVIQWLKIWRINVIKENKK
jgi:hypothetical protein